MAGTTQLKLSDLDRLPLDKRFRQELKKAYARYRSLDPSYKIISTLTQIAADMFRKSWEILERHWQQVSTRGGKNRKIENRTEFWEILSSKEKESLEKELDTVLREALQSFKTFLEDQEGTGVPDSHVYDMLLTGYAKTDNPQSAQNPVKELLWKVRQRLQETHIQYQDERTGKTRHRRLRLSHELEPRHYERFQAFFGITYDQVRRWKSG